MVKLTEQQERAIYTKDKNIIVSAQAGAGKTHVLVSRIINLLKIEKIDITEMLIVTFTNKAAREMKDRIKRELSEMMNISLGEDLLYYQKQYNKTINAQISTLHSFCINILKAYFYKLGINPNFRLIDSSSLNILKWKAINTVFDENYKKNSEEFNLLINTFSKKYSDDYIKNIVFEIYNFIMSKINPFEWLEKEINKYSLREEYNEEKLNNFKNNIFEFLFSEIKKSINIFEKNYDEINRINKLNNANWYIKTIDSDYQLFQELKNTKNYDSLKNILNKNSFIRADAGARFKSDEKPDDLNKIKELIDEYRNSMKELFNNKLFDIENEIDSENQMKRNLLTLYVLIKEFHREFQIEKNKIHGMDFMDVEHLTIKLLEFNEVVEELRKKYKYIFFDEYQDANQIQDYIISKIKRENNLFFVGDIKQNIYKFRLSDPIIFKNKYEIYKKDLNSEAIDLTKNFRSHRNIINFNNYIFNSIMTDKLGDVNYNTAEHRLVAGKTDEDYQKEDSYITINSIVDDKNNYKDKYPEEFINENPQSYAVAKKVKELVSQGIKYNEIGILLRNSRLIPEIISNLELFNIPVYSDSTKFSYEDIELKTFIEILKAIDNQSNDIALLTALKSTLGNFDENDLAEIRGDNKENSFYYCFENYVKEFKNINIKLENKIYKFKNKIQEYKNLEKNMSLHDFVWYVFIDSGYMSYVLSKNNGEYILDNIKMFISEIKSFEESSYKSLSNYLNYVEKMMDRNLSEREPAATLSEDNNVVRIMTIHKSKGLEFNHVIILNLDKNFNEVDLRGNVILNDVSGIALKTFDFIKNEEYKNYHFENIVNYKKQELASEEIRILYVALTRAKTTLHLFNKSNSEDIKISANDYYNINNFSDLIYKALSYDKISSKFIDSEKTSNYFDDNRTKLKYSSQFASDLFYEKEQFVTEKTESKSKNKDIEMELIEKDIDKALNVLSHEYDETLSKIPYKKTVSELSDKDNNISADFKDYDILQSDYDDFEIKLSQPKFIFSSNDINPLQIGNLYHYLFEKINYDNRDIENIDKIIENQLFNNSISKLEYQYLKKEYIYMFLKSELYKRICNSKKIFKEKSFTMFFEENLENNFEILVDGQIDLFFEENNKLVIVDFKTNKNIDESLYTKQLNLYKMGLEKASGKEVSETILYWVMHGKTSILK